MLSLLFKSKYFPLAISMVAVVFVMMFGVFVTGRQSSTYADFNTAILQRQAISLGETIIQTVDFTDLSDLQAEIDDVVEQLPELKEVTVYLPRQSNYEVIASTNLDLIGQVLTDSQKQKASETKDVVTYRRQQVSTTDQNDVVETTIIPLIPVLTSDEEVEYLFELGLSTQEVVDIGNVFLRNNTFFLSVITVLSALLCISLGWSVYRTREIVEDASADILRKDELLATAAHDLRGPLIVIRQDINEIIEKGMQLSAERFTKLSDEIVSSTHQAIEFLEDLLVISRFERDKEQIFPRPAFLQETLQQVVDQFRPQAEEKGLEYELVSDISDLPKVIIDPGKIGESIMNYISNAIKYSDSGKVEIKAEVRSGKKSDYIVVAVKDSGVGITQEDQSKLFRSFSRVGETQQTHPGNGLGLYIVKQIVEAHGGQVGVESQIGEGSTFYISLPVPTAQALEGAEVEQEDK